MRIGIDARTILSNRRGFRRLRNLLEAFFDWPEEDFFFFAPAGDRPLSWQLPPHVRWEDPARRLRLLHRRGVRVVGSRLFRDLNVFHFPTAEIWYSKYAPTVVTLHDLTPLHCAELFFKTWKEAKRYRNHLNRIVANADRIVTVSQFSRRELMDMLGVPGERVRVIYQGFEDVAATPPGTRRLDAFADLQVPGPYLFYCGGLDFRKNVEGLIRAFAYYRHKIKGDRVLVVAGEHYPGRSQYYPDLRKCAEQESVSEWVLFPGWVEDDALGAYYRQADAFVFPSLFEGFGYPPLEAMAARTPVICSKASALPETVGDAALLVDATDPTSLGQAMAEVTTNVALREELIQKGLANLHRFDWKQTANECITLYREVAEMAGGR